MSHKTTKIAEENEPLLISPSNYDPITDLPTQRERIELVQLTPWSQLEIFTGGIELTRGGDPLGKSLVMIWAEHTSMGRTQLVWKTNMQDADPASVCVVKRNGSRVGVTWGSVNFAEISTQAHENFRSRKCIYPNNKPGSIDLYHVEPIDVCGAYETVSASEIELDELTFESGQWLVTTTYQGATLTFARHSTRDWQVVMRSKASAP